jgi:hypothetical protein
MAQRHFLAATALLAAVAIVHPRSAAAQAGGERTPSGSILRTYETPYYMLYTDLGQEEAREADLRMTRMFEEYQRRTAGFAGKVQGKFPFYLYRNEKDYLAAGGVNGSAGVYIESVAGKKLMAIAGQKTSAYTWHVVQHEGFHQFIAATIHNDIPIWVNEGLAEYFGESLWTGDGFVPGLAPMSRVAEVKGALKTGQFKQFSKLMTMSDEEWGSKLEYSNYTQAWAMVHFLAHADNGKYQGPFVQFMSQVSKGTAAQTAWTNVFGKDTIAFQNRFANWWLSQPEEPTRTGYIKAFTQTATSFYARAYLQKQTFPDIETFFRTYKPAQLSLNRDLWLPPALFGEISKVAPGVGSWSLEQSGNGPPKLICTEPDGTKYTGTFVLNGNKIGRVGVDVTGGSTQRTAPNR